MCREDGLFGEWEAIKLKVLSHDFLSLDKFNHTSFKLFSDGKSRDNERQGKGLNKYTSIRRFLARPSGVVLEAIGN